jgi:hypothetical protein
MNLMLYVGVGLMIVALSGLIWAAKTKAPAHFFAQALVIGELALMAFAQALITNQLAALVVVAMLGLGALVSVWIQIKLVRAWRAGLSQSKQGG